MLASILALLASPAGQAILADLLGISGVSQADLDKAVAALPDPPPPYKGVN